MSYPFNGYANVGRSVNTTASTGGALVFPAKTGTTPHRSNVLITNHDAAITLYVVLVQAGAVAPTINATNNNGQILAGNNLNIPVDVSIDIYIASASATPAFTALEMSF